MFDIDLSELDDETVNELLEGYQRELLEMAAAAERMQPAVGRANERGARAMDGVGEVKHRLGPFEYHLERYLGHDHRDPDFHKSRYFRDKYPHARVKCGGTKTQVGWTPEPKRVVLYGPRGEVISGPMGRGDSRVAREGARHGARGGRGPHGELA